MRKILFSRQSECIQPIRALIEQQKHRTLVVWALDCAVNLLQLFEARCPQEQRPREVLEAARLWMRGEIKMPLAKKAILAAHNAATQVESDPVACAAARAIGHAAATVHVETHALGVVFYGLTAFVYAAEGQDIDLVIAQKCQWFYERLLYWQDHINQLDTTWAAFLQRENVPNKEHLLHLKEQKSKVTGH